MATKKLAERLADRRNEQSAVEEQDELNQAQAAFVAAAAAEGRSIEDAILAFESANNPELVNEDNALAPTPSGQGVQYQYARGAAPIDRSGRINPLVSEKHKGKTVVNGVNQVVEYQAPDLVGHYDIVIVPSQQHWQKPMVVFAALDRFDPEFVIFADANRGVDRMALSWAESRNCEYKRFTTNWGDGPNSANPGLGPAAGPVRNAEMLDLARKLQFEGGKTVAIVYFPVLDQFGRDQITDSMLSANAERNAVFSSQPQLRKYIIPAFDGLQWMNDDALASNPFLSVEVNGERIEVDLPIPSRVQ